MTKPIQNDGGPAFPRTQGDNDSVNDVKGMTLRQWYAGMVLMGMKANPQFRFGQDTKQCAKWAFQHADAMIKEGNIPPLNQ